MCGPHARGARLRRTVRGCLRSLSSQPLPFKVTEATAQQVGNAKPPPPAEQAPAPQEAAPGVSPCSIKVIGVGGGGGNTLNRMVSVAGAESFIDFVAINTDVQALAASQADVRMQIGDDGAVRASEPHRPAA